MPNLPTCWYCPECRMVANFRIRMKHALDGSAMCNAAMIEVPIIAPGTPLEAILRIVGDVREATFFDPPRFGAPRPEVTVGKFVTSGHPTIAKFERPAWVVIPWETS